MVVSCGQHIEFYRSCDLLEWRLVSEFGYRQGAHSKGPWECLISLSCHWKGRISAIGCWWSVLVKVHIAMVPARSILSVILMGKPLPTSIIQTRFCG